MKGKNSAVIPNEIVEVLSLVRVFSPSVFGSYQTGAMMFTDEGRGLRQPSGFIFCALIGRLMNINAVRAEL